MAPMPFGLSTHVFHAQHLDRRHLEIFLEHGFDLIEVFATQTHFNYKDPREVDAFGLALADLGMRCPSMHAPICEGNVAGVWGRTFSNASGEQHLRREAIAETTAAFGAARTLGCEYMVVHLGIPHPQDIPPGDNDAAAVRRSLDELAEISTASGVKLALEIIPNDLSTPDALLGWLADHGSHGESGICLDVGHAHLMCGAPEAIDQLSGHIIATHVHDNAGTLDDHMVPFDGTIDWPATLTAMWKFGYSGRLIFEVANQGDPVETIARTVRSRARLQAILDELTLPISFDDV